MRVQSQGARDRLSLGPLEHKVECGQMRYGVSDCWAIDDVREVRAHAFYGYTVLKQAEVFLSITDD